MASVTLADSWFHLASDPDTYVKMVLTGESDQAARPVETRRYAGGRVRVITRPGVKKELGLNFELADRADLATLESWIGEEVMFRDVFGRLIVGVYGMVSSDEIRGAEVDVVNINLTLSEVTYSIEA